jgi:hypothetical protein
VSEDGPRGQTVVLRDGRLPRLWRGFQRLTRLSFPRGFAIVQFPNLPLIVAFLAGEATS